MSYNFTFTVRCYLDKLSKFKEWCNKGNKDYQDVIREVMDAAPEGRVTIIPSKEQKKTLKELYKS